MPGRGIGERLAVDPHLDSVIYFGARSGHGLWKSTDSGASFSQVTSFPNIGKYIGWTKYFLLFPNPMPAD